MDPDAHFGKDRREPPAGFREKWKLNGIVIAGRDERTGEDIPACCFEGNERFYRIGDRLEGTEFTVRSIHLECDYVCVDVEGDNGLLVKLSMLDLNRYK
ncbi:hypothetical protein PLCT1_02471 [Planctomycetaceae bacterium]|nr:hypothetical protein PLCT1_02471 [Planctomycetaceae bacterium]